MTHRGEPETGSWMTAGGAVLRAARRPDGAWSVRLPEEQPSSWADLVEAATRDGCTRLLVSRPADKNESHAIALRRAGFTPARTETRWRIPTATIPTAVVRTEHRIRSVTEFHPATVADLDNAVRAQIPGTEAWVGTGAQLLDSLDDPEFDPALYLVAQHRRTGHLDGLVRVWNRLPDPRLGCVGVIPDRRRTGLALVLMQVVARTLRARGVTHVTAETDHTNRASHLMALNHGGIVVGTSVEWERSSQADGSARPTPATPAPSPSPRT